MPYADKEKQKLYWREYARNHRSRKNVNLKRWSKNNKEKLRAWNKKWGEKNPDKLAVISRRSHLKKFYNISIECYEEILIRQNGRCAGCLRLPTVKRRLAVDHNHVTNDVRGLLCGKCNRALGLLSDSPEILDRLRFYLENNGLKSSALESGI